MSLRVRPSAGRAPAPAARQSPRERLYVSSPIGLYGGETLRRAIAYLRARFPGAELQLPEVLFSDRRDWLMRAPKVLEGCTGLVVVTDAIGWVGRGVVREVATVLRTRKPVSWLPPGERLIPWAEVVCSAPDESDWTRHVRLTVRTARR